MLRHKSFLPVAILSLGAIATASIERLTLEQMIARVDNAVYGEIIGRDVSGVVVEEGSDELFFTTLTIQGRSILNGEPVTVMVSYPGGFVDDERGVFNSEAPSADDVRVGNRVLAFYKWSDNMGGGFASNALYASHGGLFRTFTDKKGRILVQGRGEGYAVSRNRSLTDIEKDARKYEQEQRR